MALKRYLPYCDFAFLNKEQDLFPIYSEQMAEDNTNHTDQPSHAQLIISEVELLLSEKRTALSVMRTGIAVFALPLSVFSILIATSKYYTVAHVILWLVVIGLLCLGLILLGGYLVIRSLIRLHKLDDRIVLMKDRLKEMPGWISWGK